jgi:hypothetical protein
MNNRNIIYCKIVQKFCPIHFIKFVPDNIINCPFVILTYIEIYNYLTLVLERTSITIKSNLQSLIEQFIKIVLLLQDFYSFSYYNYQLIMLLILILILLKCKLLTKNLIKTYFNKEGLFKIHVSFNNINNCIYLAKVLYCYECLSQYIKC